MAEGSLTGLLRLLASFQVPQQSPLAGGATPNPSSLSGAQQLAAILSGSSITPVADAQKVDAATPPPLVWLGERINKRALQVASDQTSYDRLKKQANGAGGRIAVTPDAAINLPFTWDEKTRENAYKRVSESIGQPIQSFEQFNNAWASAAKIAQQSWVATDGGKNGSPLTVWDVFDLTKREGQKYGFGGSGGGAGGGPRTTVSTSSSVEKLSDGSMWQIMKGAATNALGRAPTNDELQRFASRANQIASSNPTKTRTTTTTTAGGSSSHSTTKQGASAGDYELAAENQVNSDPEAGAYQAATTYANALFGALDSPV